MHLSKFSGSAEAVAYFDEMVSVAGLTPTPVTFATTLKAVSKTGNVRLAGQLMWGHGAYGLAPIEGAWVALFYTISRAQKHLLKPKLRLASTAAAVPLASESAPQAQLPPAAMVAAAVVAVAVAAERTPWMDDGEGSIRWMEGEILALEDRLMKCGREEHSVAHVEHFKKVQAEVWFDLLLSRELPQQHNHKQQNHRHHHQEWSQSEPQERPRSTFRSMCDGLEPSPGHCSSEKQVQAAFELCMPSAGHARAYLESRGVSISTRPRASGSRWQYKKRSSCSNSAEGRRGNRCKGAQWQRRGGSAGETEINHPRGGERHPCAHKHNTQPMQSRGPREHHAGGFRSHQGRSHPHQA